MVASVGDVALSLGLRNYLDQSEKGKEVLRYWTYFQYLNMGVQYVDAATQAARSLTGLRLGELADEAADVVTDATMKTKYLDFLEDLMSQSLKAKLQPDDFAKLSAKIDKKGVEITGIAFDTNDDIIDVIIHSDGTNYKIFIDKVEQTLTPEGLAKVIARHIPKNKKLRLLSCNNPESAKRLAEALPTRKIVASDSPVDLYHDGTMEGGVWKEYVSTYDNNTQKYALNEKPADTPPAPTANTNKGMRWRMGNFEGIKLQLESKLATLTLHSNPSENTKLIAKIIKNMEQNKSVDLADRIISGAFDSVEGYKALLKKIANGQVMAADHVLETAERYLKNGTPADKMIMEIEASAYDIDFALKNTSGSYSEVYQCKSAGTPNSGKNRIANESLDRLKDAPCSIKIFEVRLETGTISDFETQLVNGVQYLTILMNKKNQYPTITFRVKDGSGSIKDY
jgi:hypothetical protein